MKLYTRTGDKGGTGLFGGQRVSKSTPRIQAVGAIDELNAAVGLLLAQLEADGNQEYTTLLHTIQNDLFNIGSHAATPYSNQPPEHLPIFRPDAVLWQEQHIDQWSTELPELTNFILPGGTLSGATTHWVRTVCRRAERAVITLATDEHVHPHIIEYLNRLADLLFTLARRLNHQSDVTEHPWQKQTD